jgi:transcriptional regulator NrdR family protein
MKCPVCGVWSTVLKTIDTDEHERRRNRLCGNEHRFFTQEVVVPSEVVYNLAYQKQVESGKLMAVRLHARDKSKDKPRKEKVK